MNPLLPQFARKPINALGWTTCVFMAFLSVVRASAAMPVPEQVKSVVGFIFVKNPKGEMLPNGTGFFVGLKIKESDAGFVYFVTAKHVLRTLDQKDWLPEFGLRLNRKDGGADLGPIPIVVDGPKKNVFTHPDPTVDIAVVPLLPDLSIYEAKWLDEEMIITQEKYKQLGIREGSEVFLQDCFYRCWVKETTQ